MSDTQASTGRVLPAVSVESLSATYRVRRQYASPREGLRARFSGSGGSRLVHALRGVTFDVPKGSVLGVIGRNGAGKSTLLRAIAGIVPPSDGRVVVRGQLSALLSQGIGFNRQLTGRENIVLGGLAIGLDEDHINDISEEIIDFAELDDRIDYPVRSYSSGMVSRLAFSISAHLDPEILLIDEALAGGDSGFKKKCATKMFELCNEGRTILVVTHGLKFVRLLATDCLWLHDGEIIEAGEPDDVLRSYMQFCKVDEADEDDE